LEHEAAQSALAIERAREAEERAAFAAMGRLAAELSAPPADGDPDSQGFRRQLEHALAGMLAATGFNAAAVYQLGIEPGRLDLVSQSGLAAPPEFVVGDSPRSATA